MEAIEDKRTEVVTLAADVVAAITKQRNKSLKEIDEASPIYSSWWPTDGPSGVGTSFLVTRWGVWFRLRMWRALGIEGRWVRSGPEPPLLAINGERQGKLAKDRR